MRLLLSSVIACASLCVFMGEARANKVLQECHDVAVRCRALGLDAARCRRKVDECMSRHACEEVRASCLELMEIDESITEAVCGRKRDDCRKHYGQK